MKKWGLFLIAVLLTAGCATNQTNDRASLVDKLQQGGYVIFFRHAATDHSQKDTDLNNPTNCASQRHLSEHGKEQARTIGEGFKSNNIPVGDVFTSQFCRCSNTAKIAFGKAQTTIDITSIQGVTPEERLRRIAVIRKMLNTFTSTPGTNTVLVAHKWMFKEARVFHCSGSTLLTILAIPSACGLNIAASPSDSAWPLASLNIHLCATSTVFVPGVEGNVFNIFRITAIRLKRSSGVTP